MAAPRSLCFLVVTPLATFDVAEHFDGIVQNLFIPGYECSIAC